MLAQNQQLNINIPKKGGTPMKLASFDRLYLLSLPVAMLWACPGAAYAQSTDNDPGSAQPEQTAAAPAAQAPAAQASGDKLQEIIVTARKTRENLQNTPISITAFNQEALEAKGITSINRIQDSTPNITFLNVPSNSGVASNAAIYIRGIGQNDFAPGVDPGVGVYVDGVYLGRSVGGVFDMIDVESVEVLRGPQGTLFGRNTIGGAINITTVQPGDVWTGRADIKYGTDNRINVRGFVAGPLTDTLSMKLGGGFFSQDGYVNAPYQAGKLGNQDTKTVRGALRWKPVSNLSLTLAADYMNDKSHGAPVVVTGFNPNEMGSMVTLNNAIAAGGGAGLGNPADCYTPANATNTACYNSRLFSKDSFYGTDPTFSKIRTWSTSFTAAYDINSNTQLKSITAYRRTDAHFAQDRDGSNLGINYVEDKFAQKQFTQELQLTGKLFSGAVNYVVGAFYFHEQGKDLNPVTFLVVKEQSGGYFNYKSWAGYAQATWHLTDKLDLTGGLRYTQDKKIYTPDEFFISSLAPFYVVTPGDYLTPPVGNHNNANKLTKTANLSYHWTPNLMTYFTYAEGFKGGGFTQRITAPEPTLPTFRPETDKSYELGFKFEGLDHRLRFNADIFNVDYNDMQLLVADASRIGPYYTNAGRARIRGLEAELTATPGDDWRLSASAGLTDAQYRQLDNSVQGLTLNSKFVLVSKWTLNASIQKDIWISDVDVVPHVDWAYRSGYNTNANGINYPYLYQSGFSLFNANIRFKKSKYTLTVGVDNIGNKKYRTFGDYQPSFGFYQESFDRGRQWYVKAGVDF